MLWVTDHKSTVNKRLKKCYKYLNIAKQGTTCIDKLVYRFSITEK